MFKLADRVHAFKTELEFQGQQMNNWHVLNFSRDFERDGVLAFFLSAGAWSSVSAFEALKGPQTEKE